MSFNANDLRTTNIQGHALRLAGLLVRIKSRLEKIQTDVAADNFNSLLRFPETATKLDASIQSLISQGIAVAVRNEIVNLFNKPGVTNAVITQFSADVLSLRTDIINNAALFLLSFDSNDQYTFITPVSAGVKTAIQTRLTTALANVNTD